MTTRKASAILSLLGLGFSLSLVFLSSSPAAPSRGRALSTSEMAGTRGTSYCGVCACNNGNGCVNSNSAYITWNPVFVCAGLGSGCTNSLNTTCWTKDWFTAENCPNYNYYYMTTSSNTNYCGPPSNCPN